MKNEEIKSFELGYGYVSDKLTLNINVYSTNWGNRFITRSNPFTQGTDGTAQLKDIDVTHKGLEIEGTYKLSNATTIKGMASLGDWTYDDNFTYRNLMKIKYHKAQELYILKAQKLVMLHRQYFI